MSKIPLPSTGEGLEKRSFAGLPIPIVLHRHNNHIILAAGNGTLDRVIDGLDNSPEGLNDDTATRRGFRWHKADGEHVPATYRVADQSSARWHRANGAGPRKRLSQEL